MATLKYTTIKQSLNTLINQSQNEVKTAYKACLLSKVKVKLNYNYFGSVFE